MRQVHLKISGKVQGVFFRAEAKAVAQTLKLRGWIRNTSDGNVEAVAQGEEHALKQFVAWCQHGPEHARVDRVEVREEAPDIFADFAVGSD